MATKNVSKISDKLTKVSESFTVYMYDNGYMLEASGRDKKGDYVTAKIMCANVEEVLSLVKEAVEMDRDV